ncbi:MAG: signal recognition particle-docking protein FtsY [Fimbriimonadales bacterium]|nr:signal recognition particle-docking protein FtsY [Fimbriimonadales bacterium]
MRLKLFKGIKDKLDRLFGRGVVDESLFEDLEEVLLSADVGITVATEILDDLRMRVRKEKLEHPEEIRSALAQAITKKLANEECPLVVSDSAPTVYLFLGVNGAGKTTTIAKLAHKLKSEGKRVLVAAADTFRAAAIEQLDIWAQRVGVEIVKGVPGGDPGAVVFDAITAAKARGVDFVLADTAGRQHTRANLMQELEKIGRVSQKALGRPPDEVLLVIDGNTGQNAIRQAEEFGKVAGVTGVVVTKLDGTARGGAILGVKERLGIPVKLIGVGEKVEDLRTFDAKEYADALLE